MSHKKGSIIWKGNVWEKLLVTHGKIIYIYWENYAIQCKILYLVLNINSSQNILLIHWHILQTFDFGCVFVKSVKKRKCYWSFFFFNCYLAVPQPTLGHSQGDSFTNPMLITAFLYMFDPKIPGSLLHSLKRYPKYQNYAELILWVLNQIIQNFFGKNVS